MVDVIQHRYGWTDEEILRLPYGRLVEISEVASQEIGKEKRGRMEEVALLGYQFYISQPRINRKSKPISWQKWKDNMGLKDEPLSASQIEQELRKSRENEEKVRKAFGNKT